MPAGRVIRYYPKGRALKRKTGGTIAWFKPKLTMPPRSPRIQLRALR
jgi:hypothetical protein